MNDKACYQFFQSFEHVDHRQSEAMGVVFVNRRSQKEVADQFGDRYSTMRQVVYEFRHALRRSQEPSFFER